MMKRFAFILLFVFCSIVSWAVHYAITGTTWGAGGTTWAATSGGAATLGDPTSTDAVIFDANSPNVTCSGGPVGLSLTTTGYNGTISGVAISIYGDVTLSSSTTVTVSTINILSTSWFTSNSATLSCDIYFNSGFSALSQIGSALITTGEINVNANTFATNNHNVTCSGFRTSSADADVRIGSSTITITAASTVSLDFNLGLLTAGTSTIKFTNTGAGAMTFAGGGKTFYNVWFDRGASTGETTITGANTFNELKDTGTGAHTITFPNVTTTVTSFIRGANTNIITLQRTGASGTWTISKSSGKVCSNYLSISNSTATGGASWYAGANSTDGGGNTGWTFTACPTFHGHFFKP